MSRSKRPRITAQLAQGQVSSEWVRALLSGRARKSRREGGGRQRGTEDSDVVCCTKPHCLLWLHCPCCCILDCLLETESVYSTLHPTLLSLAHPFSFSLKPLIDWSVFPRKETIETASITGYKNVKKSLVWITLSPLHVLNMSEVGVQINYICF